ncbi:UNVERIFIED_CONTAM: hypothetical protein GTU68_010523 [Idotea baltica]|nr:hypothetical protein [Idotea baltica]
MGLLFWMVIQLR